MKTRRDILLRRHAGIGPKLDNIREAALRGLTGQPTQTFQTSFSFLQLLFSLRWHLAGSATVWMLAMFLNLEKTPSIALTTANDKGTSPRQMLAELQEHRRQLLKLEDDSSASPEPPNNPAPAPRSEMNKTNLLRAV